MEKAPTIFVLISSLLNIIFLSFLIKRSNEIKKLKNQLSEFKKRSSSDMYALGKFSEFEMIAAGVTHEISNPLSVILARSSQLLKSVNNEKGDDTIVKGITQIHQSAEKITTLIKNLRSYIGRSEEAPEEIIALKDILSEALGLVEERLKNHGIQLRLKNIEKIFVSGHKKQYEQAILNLISNSFDAIDQQAEKWIEISASKTNERVQLYITDSGHGISKEIRHKMFEPFYTSKKGKGTGLGLTIVRGLIQRNGGNLKYVEGANTTFLLELPKAAGHLYHQ